MAYTFHGTRDLVMAPGRSVQTFPSGLVRVERRYLCRRTDAIRFRSDLAVGNALPGDGGAPAFDGLYIFPEAQEQAREDGFTEFQVTAYGRSNVFSLDAITRQSISATYPITRSTYDASENLLGQQSITANSVNEVFTVIGVLPASDSPASLFVAPSISNPLIIPAASGTPLVSGLETITTGTTTTLRETSISLTQESFESKSFGRWSEYTVVWRSRATVLEYVRPI